MILVSRNIKYADIRPGYIGEGASSTISGNFEHEFCGRTAWRIYTRHMLLRAVSHTCSYRLRWKSTSDQCAECDVLKFRSESNPR